MNFDALIQAGVIGETGGIVLKLVISAIFGLVIGIEREIKHKPLGLKTTIIISVVSCLLTIVSIEASMLYSEAYARPMDPGRIPSYVISGIGFIGAGVIMKRNDAGISGLTTASLVFAAAGIGIAVGSGFYALATVSMLLIVLTVELLPFTMKLLGVKALREKEIRVNIVINDKKRMTEIIKEIKNKKIKIKSVKIDDLTNESNPVMEIKMLVDEKRYTTDVYYDIHEIEGIGGVKLDLL